MAWVFSAYDRFENPFGEGAPLRSKPLSNDRFRTAAQMRFGVPLTCLKSFTNLPLKSNAPAPGKFVDATGCSTVLKMSTYDLWRNAHEHLVRSLLEVRILASNKEGSHRPQLWNCEHRMFPQLQHSPLLAHRAQQSSSFGILLYLPGRRAPSSGPP